jgi:hypothetical protein
LKTLNRISLKLIISTILIFFNFLVHAQKISESGFNLGLKLGVASMLGEIPNGSFAIVKEFDHQPGFDAAIEISKDITPRIQTGIEAGVTILNGNTNSPEFSAEGINNPGLISIGEIDAPVKYQNVLSNIVIVGRYYVRNIKTESAFNPFLSVGGGLLNYNSLLQFVESGETIVGKGQGNNNRLSTAVFRIGAGFKTTLSNKMYLITASDFNFVGYDFLDVVHNYDSLGERQKMRGLYVGVKAGLFFNFGNSGKSQGKTSSGKKSGNSGGSEHLPFAR